MTPQLIPVGGSRSAPATLILSLCCLAVPGIALGQQAADSALPGLQATRVALESLAQRAVDSSGATRDARLSPAAIRARLTDGDVALSDALTAAGGPTQDAKLDKVRVERVGKRVLEGKELRLAFAEGRTLDEMQLRSGDQFVVPGVPGHGYDHVRFWATLLSIPVPIYALAHAFYAGPLMTVITARLLGVRVWR